VLPTVRPVVLPPNFELASHPQDPLGLTEATKEVLRDVEEEEPVASKVPIVFQEEGNTYPGGYQIKGRYTVTGSRVQVQVWVVRDKAEHAEFVVVGRSDDVQGLAEALVERLRAVVKP
jgi:hypothetical protein